MLVCWFDRRSNPNARRQRSKDSVVTRPSPRTISTSASVSTPRAGRAAGRGRREVDESARVSRPMRVEARAEKFESWRWRGTKWRRISVPRVEQPQFPRLLATTHRNKVGRRVDSACFEHDCPNASLALTPLQVAPGVRRADDAARSDSVAPPVADPPTLAAPNERRVAP
jgi:hypothetical protein